ncbi:BTAD domain-containing putative transcriptional regulator [Micromonospora sp. NPDC047740]|uniref:BTAD domain-containing putative transcriptional regulator n=1 Tax=Micromonospora sp. NPDC047740 TaxID=3364254 RepID=UPI003714DCCD
MQFHVLGQLEVVRNGQRVPAGGPKQQALLVLLLLRLNRFVASDWLVDALWDGRPPVSGQMTLRTYVAGLRRALEPDRAPRGQGVVVVGHTRGYELRAAPDAVDAVRFERLVDRAAALLAAGDAAGSEQCYRAGLALWRGEPLAAAADLDAVRPEAARLAELRLDAEEGCLTAGLAANRHEAVLPALRRFVGAHPLREAARARLMLALYRSGRQTDALAVYEEGRRLLADEYGLDPGEQLREAHRLVLGHAVAVAAAVVPDPPTVVRKPAAATGPALVGGGAATVEAPQALAGRDTELARLGEALAAATGGDGRVVAVVGEAGIGKTSLAAALSAQAATSGTPVVWGRCPDLGQTPPFWLWTQVIRSLRAMPQAGDAASALPLDGFAAGPLTGPGDADVEPMARFRVYEAVADLIRAVAGQRGLLVVLDDLHAADPDSLLLLRFLSPLLTGTRALVVVTMRPYDRSAELLSTVAELARGRNFMRLQLTGLDASSVASLVASGTGVRPRNEAVASLVTRTGGNPFFITELLRSGADPVTGELPPTVRDTVRLRLAELPQPARECLDLLSVAGHDLELLVMAAVLGAPAGEVGERLVPAYAAALVVEAGPGQTRFRHPLFAEVAYAELPPPRRAALHARLAAAGERTGGLTPAELAYHYGQAIGLGHHENQLRWSLVAADDATRRVAYEDALGHLGRVARGLALNSAISPDAARTELAVQLHRASLLQMTVGVGSDAVDEVCSRARQLLGMVGPEVDLRPALWALGELAANRADFAVCGDLARRLVTAEDDGTGLISAAGEYLLGVVGYFTGHLPDAERHLTAAVDRLREVDLRLLGRQVGRRPVLAVHNFRALVRSLRGEGAPAREDILAAEVLADQIDDPYGRANAALFDGWRALQERDVIAVRLAAERCRELGAANGLPHVVTTGEFLTQWAAAYGGERGRLAAARAAGEAIYHPGLRSTRTITLCAVADAYLVAGERATAAELAEQALSVAEQLGERVCEADLRRIRGDARHDAGELRAGARLAVEQDARLLLTRFPDDMLPAHSH